MLIWLPDVGLMWKTPRGWIQIGESRIRGVARIPLRLKLSRDSRATSQRDSPIWIQALGVFRYRSCPYKFNSSINFWLKTICQVSVIALSIVLTTQNTKLLPSPNLCHSLMLCHAQEDHMAYGRVKCFGDLPVLVKLTIGCPDIDAVVWKVGPALNLPHHPGANELKQNCFFFFTDSFPWLIAVLFGITLTCVCWYPIGDDYI